MSNYIIHREEDEDYLEHFGVRGMHWGVRRYQNEDGSYKPGADGRYAPDGQPGVNKKRSGGGSSASGTSKPKNSKKSEGEEEDEEISRRADALQKKNPNMSRKDAESAAEDEMVKEASEERKKQGKYGLLDKLSDKIGEAADRKEAERQKKEAEKKANKKKTESDEEDEEISRRADALQKKNPKMSRRDAESAAEDEMISEYKQKRQKEKQKQQEEKLSKNSYKKIAGKYVLRNIGAGIASNLAGNAVAKLTRNDTLGLYTNAGLQTAAGMANLIKSGREAKNLYDYRKRKNAQHADYDYDELYHSESGNLYGIYRS